MLPFAHGLKEYSSLLDDNWPQGLKLSTNRAIAGSQQ
jgi:hypothetical protein